MSSLHGDLADIPTGEPKVIEEKPDSRTVETETFDYKFSQTDRVTSSTHNLKGPFTGEETTTQGFTYERSVRRFGKEKISEGETFYDRHPQAEIVHEISTGDGTSFNARIETNLNGTVGGHSRFMESRFPGGSLDNDETYIGFYVARGAPGTGLPPDTRVSVSEMKVVYHPNDPQSRETFNERSYSVERRSGEWKTVGDTTVANLEIVNLSFDPEGNISGSRVVQPDALRRSGIGVINPETPQPETITAESARELWEKEIKSLVETARRAVEAHPESRLILDPESQYLIVGEISSKPPEPHKDFVAKEMLRAI